MRIEDYNHVELSIQSAVFTALEDTGLDSAGAAKLIEVMTYVNGGTIDGIRQGLRDYQAKLILNGRPKPRNI
jgi:hypothetical protein